MTVQIPEEVNENFIFSQDFSQKSLAPRYLYLKVIKDNFITFTMKPFFVKYKLVTEH